jgi:DNA-binding response OmpR family regulator
MRRLLIVDDERDIAMSLKAGLERKGFAVDAFTDPKVALDNYKPNQYDLLIIDIRMPKLNGFELVRSIKKKDGNALVWFLTAFEVYYDEFKRIFPDLDVKSFIRKPISANELANMISKELERIA